MDFVCRSLNIACPTYLDIGTNDPVRLNNTYLFYKRGCTGVLVEPDPTLYATIRRRRNRDLCLNIGISFKNEVKADFYEMTDPKLNTFSKEEALRIERLGSKRILRILKIDLLSITTLLERYFVRAPDIMSLDIEGLDFAVLQSLDFGKYRPKIICVETLTYSENNTGQKLENIIELLKQNSYRVYADTYINTIFIDDYAFNRGQPRPMKTI
jgi:FkbM family methyltransferase